MSWQAKRIRGNTVVRVCYFLLFMVFIAETSTKAKSANSTNIDKWYYTDESFQFQTPDKFQHFIGSRILVEATTPLIAMLSGIGWEIWEQQTGRDKVSLKDLFADFAGVASGAIHSKRVRLWIDWKKIQKELTLQVWYNF